MSLHSVIVKTLVFLICLTPLWSEDEIRVELNTKNELSSAYISEFQIEQSTLNPGYVKRLKEILCFDLAYSGYLKIAPTDSPLEKLLSSKDPKVAFNPQRWIKATIFHVIKGIIKENKLDLFSFAVRSDSIKEFEGIPLTGEITIDRKKIHKLSDAILKTLFGIEGIADTRILYSVQGENPDPNSQEWKAEIWECDWDGGDPRQITDEQSYSITPVFIPPHPLFGSDHYLYVVYKNGQPKIYYSSLKTTSGKPLIDLKGNQLLPAISKQRDSLAFISDASGRADLFIQKIDENGALIGKSQQLFSYPRSTQASPTFSHDGKKIAFVSDKDGTPRIYIIPSTNENHRRATPFLITKKNRENTCPNWSPDGTKLAYSAKTNGVRQIWIYDVESGEETQLTTGPGNKENPCWAPNSLHIVFNSTDPESSELYLVNLNQPEAIKISSGSGKKHYPSWGTK